MDDQSQVFSQFAASCEDMATALALLAARLRGDLIHATATRQTPAPRVALPAPPRTDSTDGVSPVTLPSSIETH